MKKTEAEVKGGTDELKERVPFNVKKSNKSKLKVIAALISSDMSAIVDGLIEGYVKDYEKKNGPIPVK